MKRIQNDLAAFDTGVDPGGEYVQPKPSFMDPIGDVPRRAPLFHSTRRRRPPPAELLRHLRIVRTALSTAGFDGADLLEGGQRRPRSCWPAMPLESYDTPARRPWRAPRVEARRRLRADGRWSWRGGGGRGGAAGPASDANVAL